MIHLDKKGKYTFQDLLEIMARLRGDEGCPWDKEQTHQSIRRNFIEEVYEACEAIDDENMPLLREELGDVLLQVVFHGQIAAENGAFTIDDVTDGICRKLIVRHPHIFAEKTLAKGTAAEVLDNWEEIKNQTNNKTAAEAVGTVAKSLPALIRAEKVQKRAAKVGLDWTDLPPVLAKISEEANELQAAVADGENTEAVFEEVGDLLFAVVNAARHLGIGAEEALAVATDKFTKRVAAVAAKCESRGLVMEQTPLAALDELWEEVKIENRGNKNE